ncbi:MAG: hypothetical protein ABI847_07565 [Anaerolineales bacterium]
MNKDSRPVPQRMAGGKAAPRPMVTADERRQAITERRNSSALTRPTPAAAPAAGQAPLTEAQLLQQEIDRFGAIQDDLMLSRINDDLEDVNSAIAALAPNIENIRSRGYVFKSYLERKAQTLATQWTELRPKVEAATRSSVTSLQNDARLVQATFNQRRRATAALSSLESKATAAQRNLQGMYDSLNDNVIQTQQQIDDISWTLQQAEQASFGFLPTEGVLEAVPANWKKPDDKDGVGGVLYLTDQRLLFEQKEEVATKKVLFITTAKQKVQALAWEIPVSNIATATGSKRGFMNKDDFLTITASDSGGFKSAQGGGFRNTDVHLKGETGEAWQGFVGRVKSGEIAKERTVPVDEKAAATVSNAPTKCGTCGATITQTILRGQTELTCQYCGSLIRL